MKKKKIIINQQEQVIFGVAIILNKKVAVIEIKNYHLKKFLLCEDVTSNELNDKLPLEGC